MSNTPAAKPTPDDDDTAEHVSHEPEAPKPPSMDEADRANGEGDPES